MKIYLIRHGQSEANLAHTHAGQHDTPLTPLGCEQAAAAGERLRGITFDKIYSSDLSRARRTAELALPGCEYTTDPRLREIRVGDAMVGRTAAECTAELGDTYVTARATLDFTHLGGESRAELYARAVAFLDDLICKEHGTVAVFCHEGVIRELLCHVLGTDVRGRVAFPNCLIAVFEASDGKIQLLGWNI